MGAKTALGAVAHGGGAPGMNGDLRIYPQSGYVWPYCRTSIRRRHRRFQRFSIRGAEIAPAGRCQSISPARQAAH